ncbi:ATP-binding protein [Cytobacillus massiliigabonensis]|uniref:ATP-binding protein n=1 Tax=Cytobacillus massiliigabonensis TaxID=1871011 RepID=UPI000C82591F|nr:ATP-binding protein [Cytobacillus massiliigabonensis]
MNILQLRFRTHEEFCLLRSLIKADVQNIFGVNDSFLMEVAINEAVNNALCANHSMNPITLSLRIASGKRLIVRIKDAGEGFNVSKTLKEITSSPELLFEKNLTSECGRGLSIIKMATDKMIFNQKGNELLLMKYIRTEADCNI